MAGSHWAEATKHDLGGSEGKPKKVIDHIKTYKSSTHGDHIHEHHHTHPDHHPMEKHTTRGDDQMAEHMMQNMGTPNPGETPPDPSADASAMAGAPPTGAPAPGAMAGGPPMAGAAPAGA